MSGNPLRALIASVAMTAFCSCGEPSTQPETSQKESAATAQSRGPAAEESAADTTPAAPSNESTTSGTANPNEARKPIAPNDVTEAQNEPPAQEPLQGCLDKEGRLTVDHTCNSHSGAETR